LVKKILVVLIHCKDRVGLVAAIAGVMAQENINIVSMREHVDTATSRFFARLVSEQYTDADLLLRGLRVVLPQDAVISVNPEPEKKIIILVTKEHHCLSDMLIRHHFNTLGASVQCVIGNHAVLGDICERLQVPFYWVTHENKESFEPRLLEIIQQYPHNYLVLAKFMRILSHGFVAQFPMRIINIHHSFLPAFSGANPYKQAYLRGVKLIGATAHFVNKDLDDGPIIEQQIIPVNHTYTSADMVKAGMEIEKAVLAKALKLLFQDRVFVYNNRTVVFD
jgi:formyltetrahydrofolate deformylase